MGQLQAQFYLHSWWFTLESHSISKIKKNNNNPNISKMYVYNWFFFWASESNFTWSILRYLSQKMMTKVTLGISSTNMFSCCLLFLPTEYSGIPSWYFSTALAAFNSVQSLSCIRLFETPWIAARQASLSITNSWSSLRVMSLESVMPSSHLILGRPLLLLPPIPPSIRVFSKWVNSSHEVAKVLQF